MPMKLSIGLCKKVGLPDYGSLGASCHLEVELDQSLLHSDLDGFHRHVQGAFIACRQAVQDELARHGQQPNQAHSAHSGNGIAQQPPDRGNRRPGERPATDSQVRAIHAIARRQRLDLAAELRSRFSTQRPEELSLSQASVLIDALKSSPSSGSRS